MRRSWRIMSGLALVLAAASILLSAFLYTKVQDERERNIRTSCEATNERYDDAATVLDRAIARMSPGPQRRRAEENRQQTLVFINALVPKRDCDEYVRQQVRTP